MSDTPRDSERAREAIVRRARLSDAQSVCRMLFDLGLDSSPTDERGASALWSRYWVKNPAMKTAGPDFPIGWILEHEGKPVGYFGNIPVRYRFRGRDLVAGVATGWGVVKAYRSRSKDIAEQYFTQDADLVLITTAIYPAGRLCVKSGASRLPLEDYDEALFWVIDARGFAHAALRKKGIRGASLASWLISPAASAMIALRGARPARKDRSLVTREISLAEAGPEFDDLWMRKRDDGRLYACRGSEELAWHYSMHDDRSELRLIRCDRNGKLAGYIALALESVTTIGLERAKMLDMFVENSELDVVDALFAAGMRLAHDSGCHVLEVIGLDSRMRSHLERYRPFRRRFDAFPFFFKALRGDLERDLATESGWFPTLYDGDGSL